MRRLLLALSCLALAILAVLVLSTSLGVAEDSGPVPGARPTATPDRLAPEFDSASPELFLPDLIVEKIEVLPPAPIISEVALIRVYIKNQGPGSMILAPDPHNFFTDLYVDPPVVPIQLGQYGVYSWSCQAWWVYEAGDSTILEMAHVFTNVKTYNLYAQVDTDGNVGEANENNNVSGPTLVEVVAPNQVVHESHQDFQMGLAAGLDVTHPDGVIRRGIWDEPFTEPKVYSPDVMINDVTGTVEAGTGEIIPTTVYQVKPVLTGDGTGRLFAVWEDGRNGYWNRDIFFSRSDDGGVTWGSDVLVNDVVTGSQTSPDLAWDPERKRLYAVWQDGRKGLNADEDIYFAYSDDLGDSWSASQKLNDAKSTNHQLNPIVIVEPGAVPGLPRVYALWEDRRNGNSDIYVTRSDDGGQHWLAENYYVTDDEADEVAPTAGVDVCPPKATPPLPGGEEPGCLYVCWEDWENLEHPEIYCSWSRDMGETFGLDIPLTRPSEQSYRLAPAMAVTTSVEIKEERDPAQGITGYVPIEVTVVHLAWQQGQHDDADIYYASAPLNWTEWPTQTTCPYPYDFCFDPPAEISGYVMDSEYVMPPERPQTWPIDPTWQGQASISLAPPGDFTFCHLGSSTTYSSGVYIAWSDARTFDDWRHEIRTRRVASPEGAPEVYEPCEDRWVGVVNDDAKLYGYRNDLDEYEIYKPAATRQSNPSVYRDGSGFYVAWDDDRWDQPMEPNSVRNRDIFAVRAFMRPEAIYISPVIDARTQATWYALDWWGATQHRGDLLLQTRFGDDPYPPQVNTTTVTWTQWTGNPSSPYLGCDAGEGCFYDAPGRAIVGTDGTRWPKSQYIQYKIIIRDDSRLTAISRVTIHYKGLYSLYLPLVVRH